MSEQIKIVTGISPEEKRRQATELFNQFEIDNEKFLREIKIIMQNKESVSGAVNAYGSLETIFNDFRITKWGNGAIEGDSLRESIGSIKEAKNYIPNISIYKEILEEWKKRTDEIKKSLEDFEGGSEEAYSIISTWSNQKGLEPLNKQPLFSKIEE